jgi:hypothetical protein
MNLVFGLSFAGRNSPLITVANGRKRLQAEAALSSIPERNIPPAGSAKE